MATDKTFNNVQLYIDFNKEVNGATKQPDSVLYSNLDPTGLTNMAIEMAKIYSWAKDVFTFNPSATGTTPKITIKTSVLPEDSDTTYSFQEGNMDGAFQVRENNEAWQTIAVHGVVTESEMPEYSLANGTAADIIKLRRTLNGSTTDISSVTLGLLDANGKILETFLPSYVDDVIEGYYYDGKFYTTSAHTTEIPAEKGKIYIDIPSNTTYRYGGTTYVPITNPVDIMTGATASTDGVAGLVPAPAAGKQNSFLRGDGTWQTVVTSDIKVTQNISSDTTGKTYPLIFSYYEVGSTTTTAQSVSRKDTIYATPKDGSITATNFIGNINGFDFPTPASGDSAKYLRGDGTWATPVAFTRSFTSGTKIGTITVNGTGTDIYIPSMSAATASAAGTRGTVQPPKDSMDKYLRGDNTWVNPIDDIGILTLHCTNGTT